MGFLFGKKARPAKVRAAVGTRFLEAARPDLRLDPAPDETGGDESGEGSTRLDGSARETGIPRWRRQSLIAARKRIPGVGPTEEHLRFGRDFADEVKGLERRLIRYRLVRLLDIPDEVRGVELDVLDEGDEVAVLERRGMFRRVLCPDGCEGWVHRMTLGAAPSVLAIPAKAAVAAAAGSTHADDDTPPAHLADQLEATPFEELLRMARAERAASHGNVR